MHVEKSKLATYETIDTPNHLQFPGYPEKRLFIPEIEAITNNITLPEGPWHVANASDNKAQVELPTLYEQYDFAERGIQVDAYGRPLHPRLKEMLGNKSVGVVTGKGFFYNWGPNYTADPVIVTKEKRPRMMMIERGDGGGWAFAGGFVDKGEMPVQTALREAGEEAGVVVERFVRRHMKKTIRNLLRGEVPRVLFDGPVPGEYRRTTAHAWTHTTAILLRVPRPVELTPGDDAVDADWVYVDDIPHNTHPGHKNIIENHLVPYLNRE